jgi:carbamoyltransferase
MSVVVLGINHNNHDSAASLLIDGRVAAVAEEERFLRKKHAGDIPVHAARFCLEQTGLKPRDIDHVAFFYDPFLVMRKRISLFVRYFPSSLNLLVDMTAPAAHILSMFLGEARLLRRKLFDNDPSCRYQFHYVEHHQGHAASAFMLSPFERAAILSLDGTGEWATTWLGRGEGNRLEFLRQMSFQLSRQVPPHHPPDRRRRLRRRHELLPLPRALLARVGEPEVHRRVRAAARAGERDGPAPP